MKTKLIVGDKEIEVEISEEELKKIDSKFIKKTGYERVSTGELYYYDSSGTFDSSNFDYQYEYDDMAYKSANYYSSQTIAINNIRADRLMRQLRRFSVEHRSCDICWTDPKARNYYIYYDYDNDVFCVDFIETMRDFGCIYFDSLKTAQLATETFYNELIWYFKEYKDSL